MPVVRWFKGREKLEDSKHTKILSEPDGQQKLVISDAAKEDIGDYHCEISNLYGSASSKGQLDVKCTCGDRVECKMS